MRFPYRHSRPPIASCSCQKVYQTHEPIGRWYRCRSSYLRAIESRADFEQLDERIYYYADDELFTYSTDAQLAELVATDTDLEAQ